MESNPRSVNGIQHGTGGAGSSIEGSVGIGQGKWPFRKLRTWFAYITAVIDYLYHVLLYRRACHTVFGFC